MTSLAPRDPFDEPARPGLRAPRTEREVAADTVHAMVRLGFLRDPASLGKVLGALGLTLDELRAASARSDRGMYDPRPSGSVALQEVERVIPESVPTLGTTRTCRKCHVDKPLEEFRRSSRRKGDRSTWCAACADVESRKRSVTYRLGENTAMALRLEVGSPLLGLSCAVCAGELLAGDSVLLEGVVRVRHALCTPTQEAR